MKLIAVHRIEGGEVIAPGQAFEASSEEARYLIDRGAAVEDVSTSERGREESPPKKRASK
jgi:hypothetical protein